ncbi:MAG: glycosyltransferase family 4 protein [Candidatus Pacebacteria bacterium]|nr:glycosyltransferase family 4 protein [Candidatus Paceibacterota bacterium]
MDTERKRKILFAINDLGYGGGQLTVVHEANLFFKNGHDVKVLLFLPREKQELADFLIIPKENVSIIPFKSFFDAGSFIKLIKFLKANKPDVILSNLFFTNFMTRTAKLFFPRIKVFVREGNVPVEKSLWMKIFDFKASFLTKKIIVNAAAIKESFIKELKIPARKMEVIYNGIDEKFFKKNDFRDKRKDFGLKKDDFVLINVSSMNSVKKGHSYLIEIAEKLVKNNSDKIKLVMVGDGKRKKELEKMAYDRGISGNVLFAGGQNDVEKWLGMADVFVLTSLWEGMPNAMLEAMAMGLPAVAFNVGGVEEALEDGVNGFLIKPEDQNGFIGGVLEIMANRELRGVMSKRAIETAERFTWSNHFEQLEKLICAE